MAKEFTYKMNIDADISNLTSKFKSLKDALSSITSEGKEPKLTKMLDQLAAHLDNIKSKANTPIKTEAAFGAMEKEIQTVYRLLESVGGELSDLANKAATEKISFLPKDEQKRLQAVVNAVGDYEAAIDRAKVKSKELTEAEKKLAQAEGQVESKKEDIANKEIALKKATEDRTKAENNYKKAVDAQNKVLEKKTQLERGIKETAGADDKRSAKFIADDGREITLAKARAEERAAIQEVEKYDLQQLKKEVASLTEVENKRTKELDNANNRLVELNAAHESAKNKVVELNKTFDVNKLKAEQDAFAELRQKAQDLGISLDDIGIENTEENINLLKERLNQLVVEGVEPANQSIKESTQVNQELVDATDTVAEATQKSTEEFRQQNEAAGEVKGLLSRIKQFTGLTGAALIARRALQNALNTIKELDKQMTEMAVVTDLEVGDYWKQLPEHTERANALGMAIKDVYEAETLYYQQGLKTAQVTELSTSTLKMARIAGLSAEDATNKMTAALRGFNMEINQINADRIADVYSKLAAITASNVREISTAMTKTASLAANAGMEFETTAAFLSQIIETTRESAETAGTALKTVIARFQELKKAPEEIGEVDGEIVDANKIETALRTVGVALRDAQGQFRDLDDVFMELAGKWDSLDTNTQRYIATIAAGSRQQSRFIAMMSNYSRTQELVTAANNAAGASNEQFEKTLESLESKLAALKNAWDSFTMGFANNEFIKIAVDSLTGILNALNKISQGWDAWSSSTIKIGLVTAALIAGDKAVKAFMTSINNGNGILASFGKALKAPVVSLKEFVLRLGKSPQTMKNFTKAVQDAEPKLKNLAMASSRVSAAQVEVQRGIQTNDLEKQRDAFKEVTEAQENYKNATNEVASALGISADQVKNYEDLTLMGVDSDKAAILAKQGYTKESLLSAAATATGTDQVEEDTAALYGNTIATGMQTAAEGTAGKTKLGTWIASKLKTAAEGLETKGLIGQTIATWLQTAANWAMQASMGMILLVMLAIIAAIALLVVAIMGIIAAFKDLQANSPEGKFKSATEELKRATEQAEAAKEKYDDLKESLDKYKDYSKDLKDLTKGTREWQEALIKVNNEVLKLLDTYPKLASYISNEDGVLVISDEGIEKVLEQQKNIVGETQVAQAQALINKNNAEASYIYSQMADNITLVNEATGAWAGIGTGVLKGATGMFTWPAQLGKTAGEAIAYSITHEGHKVTGEDWIKSAATITGPIGSMITEGIFGAQHQKELGLTATQGLAERLFNNEILFDEETGYNVDQLTNALAELGIKGEEAKLYIDELNKAGEKGFNSLYAYGEQMAAIEKQRKVALQSMIQGSIAMMEANKYTQEQLTEMSNIGLNVVEDKLEQAKEELKEVDSKNYWKTDEKYKKYWEDQYGDSVVIGEHGKVTYTADGEEKKLTAEEAKAQYAAAQAASELKDTLEKLPQALKQVTKKTTNQALTHIYASDQGEKLTQRDLRVLAGRGELQAAYNSSKEFQEIYGSFDKFEEVMLERMNLASEAFTMNSQQLANLGIDKIEYNDTITSEAEKGLIDHLSQIVAVSTAKEANSINQQLNNLLRSFTNEDQEKIISSLNALNWYNADELEGFADTLYQIGINIPRDELDMFINNLKEVVHSIHDIDFTKLNEQLLNLSQILSNIKSGDQTRIFEDQTYQTLIETNPKLSQYFTQNQDGTWSYLGNSMDQLREGIEENTQAKIEEASGYIQNKINTADVLDQIFKGKSIFKGPNASAFDMSVSNLWSTEESKKFIDELLKQADAQGFSPTGLDGISEKLSLKLDTSVLNEDDVKQIIDDLRGIYQGQSTFRQELLSEGAEAWAKILQSSNVYRNTIIPEAKKAETGNLTDDDIEKYQGSRKAIMSQAIGAGLSEQDLKQLTKINDLMIEMEKRRDTSNQKYLNYAKKMNKILTAVSSMTGYEQMRLQLEQTIQTNYELLQTYQETSDEMQKMYLTKKMLQDFDIKVTEENYEYLTHLISEYLYGNEEGFINLINLAGREAGAMDNIFEALSNKSLEAIEEMGSIYENFVQQMEERGYGFWNNGQWTWGLATIKDLTEDIVEDIKKWKSPYDWLYNLNQKLEASMRLREMYEKEFTHLTEQNLGTYEALTENLQEQVELTHDIISANRMKYEGSRASLQEYINEINANEQLASLRNSIAIGPAGQIIVDKNKLYNTDYSEEVGSVIEEMISKITETLDDMNSAEDDINSGVEHIYELQKTGKDSYSNLLTRLEEALIELRQREIDKSSEINDTINDAQSELINRLQESIDEQRQTRDNQKTEQNITDKQTRLNYLQASGGNQVEILKLQKEISEDQQSYEDLLVDQTISAMQKANDKAAEQRERQIKIAESQLDYYKKYEANREAEIILNNSLLEIQEANNDILNTQAGNIITAVDEPQYFSNFKNTEWKEEFQKDGNLASLFATITRGDSPLAMTFKDALDTANRNLTAVTEDYKQLELGSQSLLANAQNEFNVLKSLVDTRDSVINDYQTILTKLQNINYFWPNTSDWEQWKNAWTSALSDALKQEDTYNKYDDNYQTNPNIYYTEPYDPDNIFKDIVLDETAWKAINSFQGQVEASGLTVADIEDPSNSKNNEAFPLYNMLENFDYYDKRNGEGSAQGIKDALLAWMRYRDKGYYKTKYATGGLADFTGPAWMDGTPSAPELVLNTTDTANFIALKDILSEIMRGSHERAADQSATNGNNYYDIKVEVDSIDSDYGVDQAADRIKELIEEDAMYRNVTAVNKTR